MAKKILTSGFLNKKSADDMAKLYRKQRKSVQSGFYKSIQKGRISVVKGKPAKSWLGNLDRWDVVHIK
jgi:hypothetical protein